MGEAHCHFRNLKAATSVSNIPRKKSQGHPQGFVHEMEDMPTYVDPSRAKGYDVEAGYDPDYIPKSGVSAPGRQGNYLPGQTNQRNEQWDGTEGDRQFRAMDLMTDQGSVARGRGHATGANSKAPSRRNSAAWEAREERNKSRRGTANTQSKYGSKIGPDGLTHDEAEIVKFWRRRYLDQVSLFVFICFGGATLLVAMTQTGMSCSSEVDGILFLFGCDLCLQVLFRFFALWPAYACGAEQFPD